MEQYYGCHYMYGSTLLISAKSLAFCCLSEKKNHPVFPYPEGKFDYNAFLDFQAHIVDEVKNQRPTVCDGCQFLEKKEWETLTQYSMIIIDTDFTCNCNCVYCHVKNTGRSPFQTGEAIVELIERNKIANTTRIGWAGGEPTVQNDFNILMPFFNESKLQMRFMTNAIKLSPYIEESLHECNSEFNVSLDSGTRETYKKIKGVDKWDTVTANIQKYAKAGRCELKYIIMDTNTDDENLYGFLNFCKSLPQVSILLSFERSNLLNSNITEKQFQFAAKMIILAKMNNLSCEPDDNMFTIKEKLECNQYIKKLLESQKII